MAVPGRPLKHRQRGREIHVAADAADGPSADPTKQSLDLNEVEPFMSGRRRRGLLRTIMGAKTA
jgi:hypothetical protein